VGPRDGLDGCEIISPQPGFDPRTFQPLASRHTDYATSLIYGVVMGNGIVVGGCFGRSQNSIFLGGHVFS